MVWEATQEGEEMTCKVCSKQYHWCSRCGCYSLEDNLAADGYCSKQCWEESDDYKKVRDAVLAVYLACKSRGVQGELLQVLAEDPSCWVEDIISEIWRGDTRHDT